MRKMGLGRNGPTPIAVSGSLAIPGKQNITRCGISHCGAAEPCLKLFSINREEVKAMNGGWLPLALAGLIPAALTVIGWAYLWSELAIGDPLFP